MCGCVSSSARVFLFYHTEFFEEHNKNMMKKPDDHKNAKFLFCVVHQLEKETMPRVCVCVKHAWSIEPMTCFCVVFI